MKGNEVRNDMSRKYEKKAVSIPRKNKSKENQARKEVFPLQI